MLELFSAAILWPLLLIPALAALVHPCTSTRGASAHPLFQPIKNPSPFRDWGFVLVEAGGFIQKPSLAFALRALARIKMLPAFCEP